MLSKQKNEIINQNYTPKYLYKSITQSYCASISNLFPKMAPQNYSPKRLPKAAPQSSSCFPKLLPKAVQQRCSPKPLPKIVIESSSE